MELVMEMTLNSTQAHLERLTSSCDAPSTSFLMSLILNVMLSRICGQFNT
jgi:hypothetical protein